MIRPPTLKKGDAIGIVAPARSITEEELKPALNIIQEKDYAVTLGKHLFKKYYQFAGTDAERAEDFQEMIKNTDIKAIVAARGGYGCVRIVDKIDFSQLLLTPKWLSGYSDFTVFHNHLNNLGIETLHATMPVNYQENSTEALHSFFDVLEGKMPHYTFYNKKKTNRQGTAQGIVVGGNLSVLYSLLGSRSFPETDGKILFLEDLDEHLYHIDRMMRALQRAGAFKNLSGLLIGSFTKMHNRGTPFGKTAGEIMTDITGAYQYPVAFGFPAGHQADNRALLLGAPARIDVQQDRSTLIYE